MLGYLDLRGQEVGSLMLFRPCLAIWACGDSCLNGYTGGSRLDSVAFGICIAELSRGELWRCQQGQHAGIIGHKVRPLRS